MEKIEIPVNKRMTLVVTIASVAFVAIGMWLLTATPNPENPLINSAARQMIIGFGAIIVFGFFGAMSVRKLFDSRPGLIIEVDGFTDNSSGLPPGKILWSSVDRFSVIEIRDQSHILVHLKDPEGFISRQTSKFRRKMFELNESTTGTPVSIAAISLKMPLDDLMKLLNAGLEKWNSANA